MAKTVIEI